MNSSFDCKFWKLDSLWLLKLSNLPEKFSSISSVGFVAYIYEVSVCFIAYVQPEFY